MIAEMLRLHAGWSVTETGQAVTKEFSFDGFDEAMVFVEVCADIARQQDHHPSLCIDFSRVTVTLTTHDVGGISERDVRFIEALEAGSSDLP
jgi:4a-hydroxytetrahydrobiopterin dehydratase